jgi:hypothetical protein
MAKKFQSKIGLQPIFSTKDPNGNPPTKGEDFAQKTRDNYEIIEAFLEVAKTSADNAQSDVDATKKAFLNVSQLKKKYDYASRTAAHADVPDDMRALGQVLIFKLSFYGWKQEIFNGDLLSDWANPEIWKPFGGSSRVFDGGRSDTVSWARSIDCGGSGSAFDGELVDCGGSQD